MKSRRKTKQKPRPRARRKPAVKARPARPKARDPLDNFIIAAARGLNLKIEKAWMATVRGHLQVALAQAEMVGEFSLPDDAEPAPVFRA